ncbi:DUF2997 domain-containing protein [Gordonia sp. (in: high G+C Gram-positive bacteria)]|jgi:hypothetical protein|uniref:DUF2997 domain-containing protein n=1 Tax=Gordonia sp. (in: high G+C Gram-positive bacteria) TaxID=84139 RepID=UPI001DBDD307|nr:DUF2997 domain-containing protein [Gordonia sp. (in: high G+C Gram-positive bacteria)]MCB1295577.1 DUF2997 domain-containing protein [Gordonia sp. (in: high G+C Gram-positive bacteria)]HMS75249.1 DUF2997 domain-containing protein [Gordonia sp. (in: high G+C Gram-positive bacteria)]HQV21188.1 DUF2997 domain-containing protein [Gordonia sp. (in: high G+C Gram-positive bacteria)]
MSTHKQIVLTVAADGSVRAETRGIVGPSCLDQIALLEDLLDAHTETSEFTQDYYRATAVEHDTVEDPDELYH